MAWSRTTTPAWTSATAFAAGGASLSFVKQAVGFVLVPVTTDLAGFAHIPDHARHPRRIRPVIGTLTPADEAETPAGNRAGAVL